MIRITAMAALLAMPAQAQHAECLGQLLNVYKLQDATSGTLTLARDDRFMWPLRQEAKATGGDPQKRMVELQSQVAKALDEFADILGDGCETLR